MMFMKMKISNDITFGHHDEIYSDKKLFNEFFKSKKRVHSIFFKFNLI